MASAKTCTGCGETKPIDDFYKNGGSRPGHHSRCKRCHVANQKGRKRVGRGNHVRSPESIRRQRLWTWYRITPERYEALLAEQGGKCAIEACTATEPGGMGRWHVDHDHSCCEGPRSCGECVRGLLCSRCNPMLGMARDDMAILLSAADYLANFNATLSALGAIGG